MILVYISDLFVQRVTNFSCKIINQLKTLHISIPSCCNINFCKWAISQPQNWLSWSWNLYEYMLAYSLSWSWLPGLPQLTSYFGYYSTENCSWTISEKSQGAWITRKLYTCSWLQPFTFFSNKRWTPEVRTWRVCS